MVMKFVSLLVMVVNWMLPIKSLFAIVKRLRCTERSARSVLCRERIGCLLGLRYGVITLQAATEGV